MKRILWILLIVGILCLLCGCDSKSWMESEFENDSSHHIVCIDGVEYIKFSAIHERYFAPHLRADKFDNPKVVRCGD